MTSQTLQNPAGDGVNSTPMSDDETRAGETAMGAVDYDAYATSVVPDLTPTGMAELAWSDGYPDTAGYPVEAWAGQPTTKYRRSRMFARWGIALAAVMTAGTAALWFGSVFYHDEQSKPPAANPPVVENPPETLPPTMTPPVPPPPPVEIHPPPKYPWVSIAVSPQATPDGGRSVGSGYGFTQGQSITSALIACRGGGNSECVEQSAIADGCVAIAVGPHGEYGTGAGSTRAEAISTAKGNEPGANGVQAFCSWDGNGVPEVFVPNGG